MAAPDAFVRRVKAETLCEDPLKNDLAYQLVAAMERPYILQSPPGAFWLKLAPDAERPPHVTDVLIALAAEIDPRVAEVPADLLQGIARAAFVLGEDLAESTEGYNPGSSQGWRFVE